MPASREQVPEKAALDVVTLLSAIKQYKLVLVQLCNLTQERELTLKWTKEKLA